MLVALISYILLNIFLARAKAEEGDAMDEGRRAEAIAKVSKVVEIINRIVFIWFKVLLGIALVIISTLIVASLVAITGIALEVAWVTSLDLWQWGTIADVIANVGLPMVISSLLLSLTLLGGLLYLCVWLFRRKRKQ